MCVHIIHTGIHTYTYTISLQLAIVRILKSNYFLSMKKMKKIYTTVSHIFES